MSQSQPPQPPSLSVPVPTTGRPLNLNLYVTQVQQPRGQNIFGNSASKGSYLENYIAPDAEPTQSLSTRGRHHLPSLQVACSSLPGSSSLLGAFSQQHPAPSGALRATPWQGLCPAADPRQATVVATDWDSATTLSESEEQDHGLSTSLWSASDFDGAMADDDENVTLLYSQGRKDSNVSTWDVERLKIGEVFTVRGTKSNLAGRTMIVKSRGHDNVTLQCFSLSSHVRYRPEPDDSFLQYNWRVRAVSTSDSSSSSRLSTDVRPTQDQVHLQLIDHFMKVKDGTWVNFEEQWTVRRVAFRRDGHVANMREIMGKYMSVHDETYREWRPEEPPPTEAVHTEQQQG